MNNYKKIEPEVIVGLGDKTVFKEQKPPLINIEKLHIHLEDWLGDDLMECFPCYIVTDSLNGELIKSDFTGFGFSELEMTLDEYFENNYQQNKPLPKFFWLKIHGVEHKDDFFIRDKELMASTRVIKFITENFDSKYLFIDQEEDLEQQTLLQKLVSRAKEKEAKEDSDS
jgi:hypothetical protein